MTFFAGWRHRLDLAATINYCFMLAGLLGQYLHTCHECCCSWQISRCMLNEECQTGLVGIQMSGMLNEKCLKWSPWRKVTMHISTHPAQVFLRHIFLHFFIKSKYVQLSIFSPSFFISFPCFVPSPPLCIFQWLTRSPSPLCHMFSPLLLPPLRPSISHLPTFTHFLHQASNTLQVTSKKIDLFVHSLHRPSPTFLLISSPPALCFLTVSPSLHWSIFIFTDWNSTENWTGLWSGTGWQ